MERIKNFLTSGYHEKLGKKFSNTYRIGKKLLEEGIRLGDKYLPVASNFVQNPYVQTAASLLPYGSIIGKSLEKGLGVAQNVLSGAKKVKSMLDKGEEFYNNLKMDKELRTNSSVERGNPNAPLMNKPIGSDFRQYIESRK